MLNISWTMTITNQDVLRRVQLKKACLLAECQLTSERRKWFTLAISSGTAHSSLFIYLFIYYVIFTQEYPISAQHCSPWGSCIIRMEKEGWQSRGIPRTTCMWMGNMTEWSRFDYVESTRKAQDRNYWQQLIATDPAMDETS